ncbi:hypothetical protein EJ02DRAFT_60573 [Clathrospora elynae]|uniref:Uncharacterized protein n=1 Tax=Clathrospora elynae TaxID=706981 RepID=A0A6A5SZX3_9PLEO|nr:hypothetical protein EJ02DRAFT_60573 [Clathrospora elynae]
MPAHPHMVLHCRCRWADEQAIAMCLLRQRKSHNIAREPNQVSPMLDEPSTAVSDRHITAIIWRGEHLLRLPPMCLAALDSNVARTTHLRTWNCGPFFLESEEITAHFLPPTQPLDLASQELHFFFQTSVSGLSHLEPTPRPDDQRTRLKKKRQPPRGQEREPWPLREDPAHLPPKSCRSVCTSEVPAVT